MADPLKAVDVSKTIGGQQMTIKSLKKNNNQYELELVYHRGSTDPQTFSRSHRNLMPNLKLTDASGGSYMARQSGGRGDGESITRTFVFYSRGGKPGEPTKLTLEVPTTTQELSIPIELVDLPMP